MKIYKVGGCVRDRLLGLRVSDNDYVVVGSSPEQMLSLGYTSVGKDFPVFLHPENKEEYALARTEAKIGEGYKGFSFRFGADITLEEDLRRRDLTINAIAEDERGNLIDPYNGLVDLNNKIIRHTSNAFSEDPLRVLRVARFLARFKNLGFLVDVETNYFCWKLVSSGELNYLSSERVWIETEKALKTHSPETYFYYLEDFGALGVIFPELQDLRRQTELIKHHPEGNSLEHSLLSLKAACALSSDPATCFAALLHDLGKGLTPQRELPHHYGHDKVGVPLVEKLCDRLKVPSKYKKLAVLSCRYHMRIRIIDQVRSKKIVRTLMKLDAFRKPERFHKFLMVCLADYRGRLENEDAECWQVDFIIGCYVACKDINVRQFLNKGYSGKMIGEEIYRERIRKVAEYKRRYFNAKNS